MSVVHHGDKRLKRKSKLKAKKARRRKKKLLSKKDLLDPTELLEQAIQSGLEAGYSDLDDGDIARAPNAVTWVLGAKYLNVKPYPKQLQDIIHFFTAACIAEGEKIITEKGPIQIENLKLGDSVWTKKGWYPVKEKRLTGRKDVYTLTTNLGFTTRGSLDHRFYVLRKDLKTVWRPMGRIQPGDYVAVSIPVITADQPARLPFIREKGGRGRPEAVFDTPTHMSIELSRLLAYLWTDGHVGTYTTSFTNTRRVLINDYVKCWKHLFPNTQLTVSKYNNKWEVVYSGSYLCRWFRALGRTPLKEDLEGLPSCIWKSGKTYMAAFLQCFFEGDGGLRGRLLMSCSPSDAVAQEIQLALLGFGILSRRKPDRNIYEVVLSGINAKKFHKVIGFFSDKSRHQSRLSSDDHPSRGGSNGVALRLRIPYVKDALAKLFPNRPYHLSFGGINRHNPTYHKLDSISGWIYDNIKQVDRTTCSRLKRLHRQRFIWLPVKSIKLYKRNYPVWDIETNGSFSVGGHLVHNCYFCSDTEYLVDIPVDARLGDIRDRMQLMRHGRCPKCKRRVAEMRYEWCLDPANTYDGFIKPQPPNELCAVKGQRSGKSIETAMMSSYITHRYLTLPNPSRWFRLLKRQVLHTTFVSVTATQAWENLWQPYSDFVDDSPWFRDYHEFLDSEADRLGVETLWAKKDTYLWYGHKRLAQTFAPADVRTLRGRTRILSAIDELGWFSSSKAKVRADGDGTWRALDRSLATVRNAANRKRRTHQSTPDGYMLTISSPSAATDPIMRRLYKAPKSPRVYSILTPTWGANPDFTEQSLRDQEGDVSEADFRCVDPSTLVSTSKGLQPIGNFCSAYGAHRIKDLLANSHKGLFQVSHAIRNKPSRTLEVETKHGLKVICTRDQKFLTVSENMSIKWVQARNLIEGVHHLVVANKVIWPDSPPTWSYAPVYVGTNQKETRIPKKMSLTLARFLGYHAAEGSLSRTNYLLKFGITDKTIALDYLRLFNKLFRLRKKLSPEWHELSTKYCYEVDLTRKDVYDWFHLIGAQGNSHTKQVPWVILQSPRKFVVEFLRGLFEGDGSIGDSSGMTLELASETLVRQTQILLLQLNILGAVNPSKGGHRLVISGINRDRFVQTVGFISDQKRRFTDRGVTKQHSLTLKIPSARETNNLLILDALRRSGGMTDEELHRTLGTPRQLRIRLVRRGLVIDSGRKRKNESGKIAKVWVTPMDKDDPRLTRAIKLHRLPELGESYLESLTPRVRKRLETLKNYVTSPVRSVIEGPIVETCDFSIPKTKRFLGNGLVLHNCDFACEPPYSSDPWWDSQDQLLGLCRKDPNENRLWNLQIKQMVDPLGAKRDWIWGNLAIIGTDRQTPRVLTLDTGEKNNSFSWCLAHYDKKPQTTVIDEVGEVAPGDGQRIHLRHMWEFVILPLVQNFRLIHVVWDRWESSNYVSELRTTWKVRAEQYTAARSDAKQLRSNMLNSLISFPMPECPIEQLPIADNVICSRFPRAHLLLQCMTVRQANGVPIKPEGGTDDTFRTVLLADTYIREFEKDYSFYNRYGGGRVVGVSGSRGRGRIVITGAGGVGIAVSGGRR